MVQPGHRTGRAAGHQATPLRRTARITGFIAGIAVLILSGASPLEAQSTGRITGVVTDSASDRPVGDVQVSVVGTRIGAMTDAQGRYTINGAPSGPRTIEARRIGYRATRVVNVNVQLEGTTTLNIRVVAIPLTLQAVVTTGVVDPTSGTRVPFTVGRIEVENIPVPSTNAIESIQGKVAAVTIVPPGQPGSGTNVLLRSPTSINKSNAPLVVVFRATATEEGAELSDVVTLLWDAKFDHLTYIAIALRHGAELRPLCEVLAVGAGDAGYWAHYRDHRTGEQKRETARRLILAAGGLNTQRLLFDARDGHGALPKLPATLGKRFSANGDFGTLLWKTARLMDSSYGPTISAICHVIDGEHRYVIGEAGIPAHAVPAPGFLRR